MNNRMPCKVCNQEMIVNINHTNHCPHCQQYDIFISNYPWNHEYVTVGDLELQYRTEIKEACLIRKRRINGKIITFPMQELTPELAKHWIDKMKRLTVFI